MMTIFIFGWTRLLMRPIHRFCTTWTCVFFLLFFFLWCKKNHGKKMSKSSIWSVECQLCLTRSLNITIFKTTTDPKPLSLQSHTTLCVCCKFDVCYSLSLFFFFFSFFWEIQRAPWKDEHFKMLHVVQLVLWMYSQRGLDHMSTSPS